MSIYFPEDIWPYGKNKGLKLKYIYQFQPSYIEWAIKNKSDFKIDIDSFENFPNPTPLNYNANQFVEEFSKEELAKMKPNDLLNYALSRDVSNRYKAVNAEHISNLINEGVELPSIDYKFPKELIALNNSK